MFKRLSTPTLRALCPPVIAFLIAVAVFGAAIWHFEQGRQEVARERAQRWGHLYANNIERRLDHALSATYTLGALVRSGKGAIADFDAIAAEMLPHYAGADSLQLAPGGVIRQIVPLAGNEKALGHDLLNDPQRSKEAFLARDSGQLTLAGPFELLQGGMGAIGRLPVFLGKQPNGSPAFWGFTTVLIHIQDLLVAVKPSDLVEAGFHYELSRIHPDSGSKQLFFASSSLPLIEPVTSEIAVPNGTWTLSVAPVRGWEHSGYRSQFWFEVAASLLFSLLLAILVAQVFELRVRQRRLIESERFARAALDALPSNVAVIDRKGCIIATNLAWRDFAEHSGLAADRVGVGASYLGACEPAAAQGDEQATTATALIRGLIAGSRMQGEFEYPCHSSQEERWFLCRAARFPGNGPVHVALAHTDVTALKLAERSLQRLNEDLEGQVAVRTAALAQSNDSLAGKEEEIRSVLDNIADAVISIDDAGRIRSTNPAVERIFGYAREELIGNNVSMLMPEPHRGAHDGYLANYRRTGQARIIGIGREVEGRHKNGQPIALDLAVSEFKLRGELLYTGVLRDIRERARIMAELRAARDEAEVANQAKSTFLAAMSHEIRTPMNGVIGMVEVLEQSSLRTDQREMVDLIRDSAFSLLGIINNILDFSKIEAGMLEIERVLFPLELTVEKACALLDAAAAKNAVTLTLFIDPAIPERFFGDAGRVRQVLVNLLGNAIKFCTGRPRARVSLRVHQVERSAQRVILEFQVADNGIGMDKVTQARVFGAFSQADASTTRRFGGTGLGLPITKNLVELMGGEIAVQSEPGQGSLFSVRLPFAPSLGGADRSLAQSEVAGLSCWVVGGADGLADDCAAYLTHDGAAVERLPDLASARKRAGDAGAGATVWVVDTQDLPPRDELRGPARADLKVSFVVIIGRGKRRKARTVAPGVVEIDGNLLTRRAFLKVVAVAAGRRPAEEHAPSVEEKPKARPGSLSRAQARQQGRLILVAEDNEINQKVILRQLGLLGFAADVVADGRAALQRWESSDYALLLTDLHMPEMDGYALTAAIRAREKDPQHTPIIALTANALKGEAERCRAAGMDDYLSKPVPLVELKSMLEKWLTAAVEPAPLPVDVSVLKALVGDDAAVIGEFLHDFRASAIEIAAELRAACTAGEATAAAAAAHKLKSSARSVGALALGELCADIEQAGKTGDLDALAALLPRFEAELAAVDAHLDSM